MRPSAPIAVWTAALSFALAEPPLAHAAPDPTEASATLDPKAAREFAAQGEAEFEQGHYDEASAAYRQAYEHDPVPVFLFAWARSEQEAGRCRGAIEIYQHFIAAGPPAGDVDRAHLEVGRCYRRLEAAAEEAEDSPLAEADPPPEADPPEPASPRAAWVRDAWGGGLLAAGVVGLATGTGLYLQAHADRRRAERATTTDEFRSASERATRFSAGGIAGFALGSALVVGAVVRYALVARQSRVTVIAGRRSVGVRVRF